MAKRRSRRNWLDDEKRMICARTRVAGVSVGQVARRYDVNANLVFTWLRDPRSADTAGVEASASFLPVEVVEEAPVRPAAPIDETCIEIDLAVGHRLRISGRYDPDALARLIRGLSG